MNFSGYKEYRSEAMQRICNNEYVRSLLVNDDDSSIAPHDMVGKYVYPFEYLPNTTEVAKSFVTMLLSTPVVNGSTSSKTTIIFYITSHENLIFVTVPNKDLSVVSALDVTVNSETFLSHTSAVAEYVFKYVSDSNVWKLKGKTVNLADYGIVVHDTPVNGDTIAVTVTGRKYLRYDLIAEEIDRMFNGSLAFGFKLSLVSRKDGYQPLNNFHGTMLVYETSDWNRKWPSQP